ncbi:MAG: ketoacyl-ACP synthase III [Acidobacteria bacterium]|nr:ketoacyl-ACP synthase III [Acidobacteriota bacterium]
MSCYIIGSGAALPERVITNAELAAKLGVAPDWIVANCGIRERRWVDANQATSDLAAQAVNDALHDAGIGAEQVDYLIGGTLSPDYQTPGIAPLVQRKVAGCRAIPALDLRAACATLLYSLQIGRGLIESKTAKTIICFAAEAQSKGLELSPQSAEISMLFGDGAGALVLCDVLPARREGKHRALKIEDVLIATDGSFAEDLIVRAPGTANGARWFDAAQMAANLHCGAMNGRTVILQAVKKMTAAANDILARHNLSRSQISLVIPHQANANLLRALSHRLMIAPERVVMNVERYGNTSSASAFLALWQAQREARLTEDAWVLILAFGAGFTWGAALCRVC